MPHASHRMDLLVVAARPEQMVDLASVRGLVESWGVDDRGRMPNAEAVIPGGCARVWLDVPGRVILYANQSGGFRASCPACGENIAGAFGRAHLAWKRGGDRRLACHACRVDTPLEDVVLQPPGAFSTWAIVFSGVDGTALSRPAEAAIRAVVGDFQVVLRRP